jgi:MFS family permease
MTDIPEKGKWLRLVSLLVIIFCGAGSLGVQGAILTPYVKHLGGNATVTGLTVGVYSVLIIFWMSPFAKLSEKFGNRTTYTVSAILLAFGSLLSAFATTPGQLIIFRLVLAFGGPYTFLLNSEVPKYFSPKKTAFAMALFSIVLGVSNFVCAIAGGYIADSLGYQAGFMTSAVLAIFPIFLLPLTLMPSVAANREAKSGSLLHVFTIKNIWVLCSAALIILTIYNTILSLAPLLVLDLGFPLRQIGLIAGFAMLGYSLIQLPAGVLGDKFGRKPMIILKTLLLSPFLLLIAFMPYMPAISVVPFTIGIAALAGMGLGIGTPAIYAATFESVQPDDKRLAMSLLFSFMFAPGVLLPVVGRVADLYGYTISFSTVAGLGIVAAFIVAIFMKETLVKASKPIVIEPAEVA